MMNTTGFQRRFSLFVGLLVLLSVQIVAAADKTVISENMVFLQDDGRSYLLHRTMRTDWDAYNFHVDKQLKLDDFYYIYPNEFDWDDQSSKDTNVLKFKQGTFVVMYPGRFESEVKVDENGVYTFNSWDGKKREDGLFGLWNSPGDFTRFVYTWVFPKHFEVIDYKSNRDGEWVTRNNTISFFADQVNSLTFTIRYREKDADGDGVGDSRDQCPDSPKGSQVDGKGCPLDTDKDGIMDLLDKCPATPAGARVDATGCQPDADGDGVLDFVDQCPDTPAGLKVGSLGCEIDSDHDGVTDSKDKCPNSSRCAKVDDQGCELDSDNDGVVDSQDKCPESPAGAKVNDQGCELDSDNDGVVDSQDKCPDSPAGAKVNDQGCEQDSDDDGVVDSRDMCPDSPSGTKVDETGCSLATPIKLEGVNFHSGSDELTDKSLAILDKVASSLKSHKGLRLEVAGHTDSLGNDTLNLDLSQRRAEAVREYLVSKGVDAGMLEAKGYGETQPIADNATAAGRAKNRRVELKRLDGE